MHIFDFGEAINHSIAYSHKSDDSRYAKSGASSPGPAGVSECVFICEVRVFCTHVCASKKKCVSECVYQ